MPGPDPRVPSISERLGGRWAISLLGLAIVAPLSLLSVWADIEDQPDRALEWLAVAVAAALVTGAWMWFAHLTFMRNRAIRPVPGWVTILLLAVGALLFSILIDRISLALGLLSSESLIARILSDGVVLIWGGATLILFLHEIDAARQERNQAIAEVCARRLSRDVEAQHTAAVAKSVRTAALLDFAPLRDDALASISRYASDPRGESAATVATSLRRAAEGTRPLTERLWREAQAQYVRPSPWEWIRRTLADQPFRPGILAMVILVVFIPEALASADIVEGLVSAALGVAFVVGATSAANALMRRWPRRHASVYVATVVFIQTVTVLLAALDGHLGWPTIVDVIVGVAVIFLASAVGSWRTVRQEAASSFIEQADRVDTDEVLAAWQTAEAARDVARLMHGAIKSRLAACAFAIDQALGDGDAVKVSVAVSHAREVLETAIAHDPRIDADLDSNDALADAVEVEVRRKAAQWEGLCELNLAIELPSTSDARSGSPVAAAVGRVVEEGIANALRHGHATTIRINIRVGDAGVVEIEIHDDGCGPAGGKPGLGTAILTQATLGRWALSGGREGACLTATVG